MSRTHELGLRLRYEGGDASKNRLELYDGTLSIHGFAQAIQIATNALVNGQISGRSTALKNAKLYMKAPRSGSFLVELNALIEANPGTAGIVAAATFSQVFYDFIKFAFGKATGNVDELPDTPYLTRLNTADEPFFDELAETMEGSLQRGHRALDSGVRRISLERPRGKLVVFDADTDAWVNTRQETPEPEIITGHVTRYNSVTGNGRAYINSLGHIVPFRLGMEFPEAKRGYLTWSLHGSTISKAKSLDFEARLVRSAHDQVKRLVLVECTQTHPPQLEN